MSTMPPARLAVKSSPVTRFRDVTQAHLGALPARMLWRHYETMALKAAAARQTLRRGIKTIEAWRQQGRELRSNFLAALGPLPPLQVEIQERGTIAKRDLVVHKFLFSSSQNNWINGCLYLPRKIDAPLPAVVLACGHSAVGQAGYAGFGAILARNGYAAITFDLAGQGERKIWGAGGACNYATSTQHNMIGSRMILDGGSLGWMQIQEAMGAVSVLRGRAEVDPERIGITGGSGGGWLSVHAAALDDRIAAVVPAAAVRSYRHELHVDDAEQTLFDMQRLGLDFPDLMGLLLCPRPTLIVSNSRDIWHIQGTQYAFDEARRFYEMHGRGECLQMMTWEREHAYQADQFTEALRWFGRWLKPDDTQPLQTDAEEENIPDAAEIQVTTKGNLYAENYPSPATVCAQAAQSNRPRRKDVQGFVKMLQKATAVDGAVPWAEMDRFDLATQSGRTICCAVEGDLLLPMNVYTPPQPKGVMILLDECGRDDDRQWQLDWAAKGWLTLRPDLRGWGETSIEEDWADQEGWARRLYDGRRRRIHTLALMVGRNLPIERAGDLRGILQIAHDMAPQLPINVCARREAAFVALLAALTDQRIGHLYLEGLTQSFQALLEPDLPQVGCESFIHGLFRWGIDVPDLIDAIDRSRIIADARLF
jgi:cephalosporin-C deacetylase-like acetyl esterase